MTPRIYELASVFLLPVAMVFVAVTSLKVYWSRGIARFARWRRIGSGKRSEMPSSKGDRNHMQPAIDPADIPPIATDSDRGATDVVTASSDDANRGIKDTLPSEIESAGSGPENEFASAPPEMKIVINSRSVYEPKQWNEPFHFEGKMPNPQDDERHYLILSDRALSRLHDSLDWGRRTRRNVVEQGGVLVGRVAMHKNEIYNFVQDVIVANTAGSPAFVEFTTGMWAEMQDELSAINDTLPAEDRLVLVGWFHTHPNGLSVFMSGTDKTTQRISFSQAWQASLVMNPHTNTYRAFFGEKSIEGKLILPPRLGDHSTDRRGGK